MEQKFEPICERKLIEIENGSKKKAVTVRLGRPKKLQKDEWICTFQISGLEDSRVQHAYGTDGFQSLIMALEGIRVALEKSGKNFLWEGGEKGDTGFPRFVPMFFGLEFSQRIGHLIDQEVNQFSTKAQQSGPSKELG
ncbi:MAG: hypothetical protein QMD05_06870 [Candidatus Brocadiaceae bacterium]|nr:hypothetical protein [Candidatus Brocadiaceae bacterium]